MEAETLKAVAYAHNTARNRAPAQHPAVARQPLALQQPAHLALGILQLPQIQAWHLDLAVARILVRAKQ